MPRSFAAPNVGAGSGSPSSSSVNSGQSERRSTKILPRAMRRRPLRPNRIYPATSGLDRREHLEFLIFKRLLASLIGASGRSPTKRLWIVKRQARVHGRRLALQLGWHGSGRRSVLGCARRGVGGVAERRREGV